MSQAWIPVFSSTLKVEIDIFSAFLQEHNIATVVVNKQDSMQHFLNTNLEVQLMVPADQVIRAKRLLEQRLK
ncbi:MAG: putative signal transducing protein [Salibacteraceae bacterium]